MMRLGMRGFERWASDRPKGHIIALSGGRMGVVQTPALVQVWGPVRVACVSSPSDAAHARERRHALAAKARRSRLSSAERYDPNRDPRLHPEWDDD